MEILKYNLVNNGCIWVNPILNNSSEFILNKILKKMANALANQITTVINLIYKKTI
jgi:exosome complex RNA-binding protein Rrp4